MLLNCGVGEDSWESLDCKEIQPVHPKGNQSWIFIGRTDAEAEALILWPPDIKSQLIGKDADGGKDWRQEEKGTTEDEMVGWHHRLDGHEFEQALGVGDGQGSLVCCSHGVAKSQTWLSNWTDLKVQTCFLEVSKSWFFIISLDSRVKLMKFGIATRKLSSLGLHSSQDEWLYLSRIVWGWGSHCG